MPRIDEKFLVPIGFAVAFIGGGGYWLATIDGKEQAQAASLGETKARVEKTVEYMESIDRRLSNIEGVLRELQRLQRRK